MGGLPPTANEQNIATFFSNALAAVGGTTAGPGAPLPVLSAGRTLSHTQKLLFCVGVRAVTVWALF